MKNTFLIACATALLSACSGPSYYLMSAKKSAYHDNNYQVAATTPVSKTDVSQPDAYAPLEASTNSTPVSMPIHQPKPVQSVPVTPVQSQPVQSSAPVSAPVSQHVPAQEVAPALQLKKKVKKFSPRNLLKELTSNMRLALIFLIVGVIVALLLHFIIGILLVIVGVVLLIA